MLPSSSGLGCFLADVGRQRDARGLEYRAYHPCCRRADGDGFAVLFDSGFLKAIEIVEEWLPFRLEPLFLTQAGEFLCQRQGQERYKHMAADSSIGLVKDGAGVEARFGPT